MKNTALLLLTLLVSIFCLAGCQNPGAQANAGNGNVNSNVGKVPKSGGECADGGGEPSMAINSPVEAYTFMFEAVKKQDTAAIKQISSQATRELAQFMAGTYKKTCADSYKNGFTETTMQPTMPETRDLRMSDDGVVAAMEVKRADGKWENLVFVKEGNGWKLGFGDLFFGKVTSPGKAQSVLEQENANARGVNTMMVNPLANKMGNGNTFKPVPVPNEKIEKPMLKNRPTSPPPANQPNQK
jgi:hypothetical protein